MCDVVAYTHSHIISKINRLFVLVIRLEILFVLWPIRYIMNVLIRSVQITTHQHINMHTHLYWQSACDQCLTMLRSRIHSRILATATFIFICVRENNCTQKMACFHVDGHTIVVVFFLIFCFCFVRFVLFFVFSIFRRVYLRNEQNALLRPRFIADTTRINCI